jgi:pyruvate dehydrogenase E1 component
MGGAAKSRMTSHQQKKLDVEALREFRDRFHLPLDDDAVTAMAFYKPAEDSAEQKYLRARRAALGGSLPARRTAAARIEVPPLDAYAHFALQADGHEMSTTTALVRVLGNLLKDRTLGPRIVRSSPTRRARSAWRTCSARSASTRPADSSTSRKTRRRLLYYRESEQASCSRRASPRRERCRRGPPRRPPTACTASLRCRSTSTTRCSASSASAT